MLSLKENERILAVVRKHWFVMARTAIIMALLLLLPPAVLGIMPLVPVFASEAMLDSSVNFIMSLYVMVILLFFFLFWMDYYLDVWIVTDQRIIDINQRGLFSRDISEIPLSRVQDVTIEIHGIIETFLKFGTMRIQTAGEREFAIEDAPRLYEIKDIILGRIKQTPSTAANSAPEE